jgi:hypothetical protein
MKNTGLKGPAALGGQATKNRLPWIFLASVAYWIRKGATLILKVPHLSAQDAIP